MRVFTAEPVKCPDTRDVWLSAVDAGGNGNSGKAERIKLKSWQEFGLLDFDVSALKGKKIEKAVLYVAPLGGGVHGGAARNNSDLRWFSISTVSSDWVEGEGHQYDLDEKGKGATFNEASYKTRPWTVPGSKLWDVILGNGKTLRSDADAGDPHNGWFAIELNPRVIEALVAKASYGLFIMDGSVGVTANCTIATREDTSKAPYLSVTLGADSTQAPAAPTALSLKPSPADSDDVHGAATLKLTVPENAFAYQIKLNGAELPRWQIPFAAKAGSQQDIVLEYLKPDADLSIDISVVDAAGNVSPAANVKGKSSPKLTVPALPKSDWAPAGGTPPSAAGKLKVWAFPEISKLDPLTGKIACETGMDDAASKNSVWDAGSATVRLAAARGEIASFQLALETPADAVKGIKVDIAGLDGLKTKQWRAWFVNKTHWQSEYAIPVPLNAGATLSIPEADNKIPEQKAASLAIDLIIPADYKPGDHTGTITVSAEGVPDTKLTIKLKVYNAVIPAEVHFNPELNCYGGPGQAGTEFFLDSFRLAHYLRSTINRVPYHQSGNVDDDYAPKAGSDGKIVDWSTFDRNIGPLLDGSAFKDNPRAGVPVPTLYLPMNENWPLTLAGNYSPGGNFTGPQWNALHHLKAKPPEQAFSQAYKDAFTNSVADFITHFEEKGWTKTLSEVFFNNKHDFGKDHMVGTAWTMDEPNFYLDWNALGFFSELAHKAIKNQKTSKIVFRGDISRPMWQGSCMDGEMELLCANSEQFSMFPLMKDHKRRMPSILYCYGACNDLTKANLESAAWCLKAYARECDGVLPWQSLGEDVSFDKGDTDGNSLIVDGRKRFNVNAIASFRVHAFRVGAQIAELLRLLELKNAAAGWGRAQSGALISQLIPLNTEFKQAGLDDAAAVTFKNLNGDQFVQLKEGVLKLLEK